MKCELHKVQRAKMLPVRHLLIGAWTAVLSRGGGLLAGFFSVPLLLHHLGVQAYGAWSTLIAAGTWVTILDFGISSATLNAVASARARGEAVHTLVFKAFSLIAIIALGLALLLYNVLPLRGWNNTLGITGDPNAGPSWDSAVLIALAASLVGLPFSLVGKVLNGLQLPQWTNCLAATTAFLNLVALIVAVELNASIDALVAVQFGVVVLLNAAAMFVLVVRLTKKREGVDKGISVSFRNLASVGTGFFVLQLSGQLVFGTDTFIVNHFLGAEQVTPYSIALRLSSYGTLLQSLLLTTLWGSYADAYARGDIRYIRQLYRQMQLATMAVTGSYSIVFIASGKWLVQHWAGSEAIAPRTLIAALGVWMCVYAVTQNYGMVLAATGKVRQQAFWSVLTAIAHVPVAMLLVNHFGSTGVVISTMVCYAAFLMFPTSRAVHQILSSVTK